MKETEKAFTTEELLDTIDDTGDLLRGFSIRRAVPAPDFLLRPRRLRCFRFLLRAEPVLPDPAGRADAPPLGNQCPFPEQRVYDNQPVIPRHVFLRVSAFKIDGHGLALPACAAGKAG